MTRFAAKLARDETGVAGLEYAFLVALIAMAIVSALSELGENVMAYYDNVEVNYSDANG